MKTLFLLLTLIASITLPAYGQTVITFAGQVNSDPDNNYEAYTSGVELDETVFSYPEGMCFDPNGRLYISERNKIRMITGDYINIRAGGTAGPTYTEGYKNGTGTQITFRVPSGMVSDADGNIFIVDADNHAIRKLTKFVNLGNGQFATTFAGAAPSSGLPGYGTSGSADGSGTSARFNTPRGITIDENGTFYVTDYNNHTIRKITSGGVVSTLSGSAGNSGSTDGSAANARFAGPWSIALLNDTTLVVSDQGNTNIRSVNVNTGETSTIAGPTNGASPDHQDGTLSQARFNSPKGLVVIDGIIYVGDKNVIRAIDIANNQVSTIAGDPSKLSVKDGVGSAAEFTEITDLVTDGSAYIYVCESRFGSPSHVVRRLTLDHLIPVANFSAAKNNLKIDERVSLTDISTGATVSSRTWEISPSNYTIHSGDLNAETLELSFPSTGFYTVKLTIENYFGSDSKQSSSYFIVSTTGSISSVKTGIGLNLYPNPASDHLNIKMDARFSNNTNIIIRDPRGMSVMEAPYKNHIDLSTLSDGLYYLTVYNEEITATKILVVNRK